MDFRRRLKKKRMLHIFLSAIWFSIEYTREKNKSFIKTRIPTTHLLYSYIAGTCIIYAFIHHLAPMSDVILSSSVFVCTRRTLYYTTLWGLSKRCKTRDGLTVRFCPHYNIILFLCARIIIRCVYYYYTRKWLYVYIYRSSTIYWTLNAAHDLSSIKIVWILYKILYYTHIMHNIIFIHSYKPPAVGHWVIVLVHYYNLNSFGGFITFRIYFYSTSWKSAIPLRNCSNDIYQSWMVGYIYKYIKYYCSYNEESTREF